jgi:hypothetical protein
LLALNVEQITKKVVSLVPEIVHKNRDSRRNCNFYRTGGELSS